MPFGNIHLQNRHLFGYLTLIVALAILVLPYNFFPQFYIAKANASTGYVGPATIEGWAFMIMGITLVLVSVFLLKFAPRNFRSTSAK
jgi:hypothetical protein